MSTNRSLRPITDHVNYPVIETHRWWDEAVRAGRTITRIALAFESRAPRRRARQASTSS
jgi:hypothetical protein